MGHDDEVTGEFREALRDAVEDLVSRDVNWNAFHTRLNGGPVALVLASLRRRASDGYRATAAAGAAWWDYAARSAFTAVPLGLAAALLLFAYLRSSVANADDSMPTVATVALATGGADSARAAFESVLTGDAAPGAVMATLIPAPVEALPPDTAGGTAR